MNQQMVWEGVKLLIPTLISGTALALVLKDRRIKLALRERAGKWFTLYKSDGGVRFEGIVEIYNLSTRANSIVRYEFWGKQGDGTFRKLEGEHYTVTAEGYEPVLFNVSPLVLAPHSGTEARVMALTGLARVPPTITVKIRVYDLFGKQYDIEVSARP